MKFLNINHIFFKTAFAKNLGTIKGFGGYVPKIDETGSSLGKTVTSMFSNFFGIMTIVGGITFFIYFLLGALAWITSSGKPDKIQKAQDKMVNAIIGLIAVVTTYGITVIVEKILGINILNPAQYIKNFWQ